MGYRTFPFVSVWKAITLYTDHKALELIYNNAKSKPPARIERWLIHLQPCDFKVIYKSGSSNPADFLSRHPVYSKKGQVNIADEYINSISSAALPNPKVISLKEIQEAIEKDRTLRAVRAALRTGYWYIDLVKEFRRVKDELSVDHTNKVILRGTRIVIREDLQSKIVELSREGHPGIARTKTLLREHVWFPNMDKQVKDEISHCIPCQAMTQGILPEPLQ